MLPDVAVAQVSPISPVVSNEPSTVGKMFLAGVAMASLGMPSRIKVRGSPDELAVITRAILAAKAFHDTLMRQGVTVEEIAQSMEARGSALAEFEARLGLKFPI